jgi:hypothetical protein
MDCLRKQILRLNADLRKLKWKKAANKAALNILPMGIFGLFGLLFAFAGTATLSHKFFELGLLFFG